MSAAIEQTRSVSWSPTALEPSIAAGILTRDALGRAELVAAGLGVPGLAALLSEAARRVDAPAVPNPVGTPSGDAAHAFADRARRLATDDPAAFARILEQTYGDKLDPARAAAMTRAAAEGALPMPAEVRYVGDAVLGDAQGAYAAADGGTIHLAESLRGDPAARRAVMAQEMGHHLDAVLGGPDTAGDEGRALAMALDAGRPLTATERAVAAMTPDHGTIDVDGRLVEVEFAGPLIPVLIWLGEGAAQTAPDVVLGEVIEQLTGVPYGRLDAAFDFLLNLIPGAGETATARKLAKLGQAIDTVVDTARLADKLPPGVAGRADALANGVRGAFDDFKDAFARGDLDAAKSHWGELIGRVREMQVAGRIADTGGTLVDINKTIPIPGGTREFDVLFDQAGERIAAEVKTGARMTDGAGASKFQRTVDNFVAARDDAARHLGAGYRVYTDEISDDMRAALQAEGIEVIINADFLR